jgi:hypothetical protein
MSVIRQENWLGQQRVDVPHLRAVESSICADFDVLAGQIMTGVKPVVVSGFDLIPLTAGSAAITLQVNVSRGAIIHPLAAEAGSIFSVAAGRVSETLNASNARVSGGFTASATNYIGLDLRRRADSGTADLVQFLDADTLLEQPKTVPLGRTLDYIIYISTQEFSTTPGLLPLAKVVTDAFNNIVSLEDARPMLCRLGSGGSIPDPKHAWPWASSRVEAGDNSDFGSGDKGVNSVKDWMDAMMTRVWELGGGQYWYSPTADRNVRMIRTGATFTNGEWFEWDGTDLHWKGLKFAFDNSAAASNTVANQTSNSAGLTDLADGDCVYVDVNRDTDGATLIPVKTARATLGTPTIPGSRYIIAWRVGTTVYTRDSSFPVGATFFPATNTSLGIVQLTYAAGNPSIPLVMAQDANGSMHNTAGAASNSYGLRGTGDRTGAGVEGVGGSNALDADPLGLFINNGVLGIGGAGGATHAAGAGVYGKGGASGGAGGGPGVQGEGVGNGAGVVGTGNGTGAGGDFTGGTTGQGVVIHEPGTSSYKPLVSLKDSNGSYRGGFDHNGFPTMPFSKFEEDWTWPGTGLTTTGAVTAMTGYTRWSYYLQGAASLDFGHSGLGFNRLAIVSAASANVAAAGTSLTTMFALVDDQTWVMEVPITINGGGTSGCSFGVGIGNGALSVNVAFDTASILFRKLSTDTNWQAVTTAASTATVTDTGVAPTTNVYQMLRIEYYGTNTARGQVVKFFIDGSLVATNTTNIPTSTSLYPKFSTTYTATQRTLNVGPVRSYWSHTLSPAEI